VCAVYRSQKGEGYGDIDRGREAPPERAARDWLQ